MTADLAPLTRAETIALDDCEQRIERGLKTFIEVGSALAAVREHRLYRATHDTFEKYCTERWGMSARHANRSIEAASVVQSMGPIGPAVANEGQARELSKVPAEERADVWAEAVERTGGKPTAKAVSDVAKERSGVVPDAVRQAVEDVTSDPGPEISAEVLRVLAAVGPNGASVAQISGRGTAWPLGIVIAQIEAAVHELAEAGQVEPAGRGMNGNRVVDLWALAELPDVAPEDHPPASGEGRSAGLPSAVTSADESDGGVATDVAADELPAVACEACGGPIHPAGAAEGYLQCDDCDREGDHLERDGVCLGCNPPPDEDEPEPVPARDPMFTPEQRRQIEADAERDRSIAHARKVSGRLVSEVSGFITEIVSGVRYGGTGLITADMVAGLHAEADRLEKWMGEVK